MIKKNGLTSLQESIAGCTICSSELPLGPRPVVRLSQDARIMIIGQAPGTRVHETGIPWNDPSGNRLREWLGVDKSTFYESGLFAIMPMGFCYPGKGPSGDLPPLPICAKTWHQQIWEKHPKIELTLLIGKYAQDYYLPSAAKKTLTETVRDFGTYLPKYLPLPHPSPRNQLWLKKNEWFAKDVLPALQTIIKTTRNELL